MLPLLLQANVTIVDIGRTAEGCAAHLAVGTATVGQCQNTVSGLGSATSAGANSWLIENVPGQPGFVYISNEVRVRCGECARRRICTLAAPLQCAHTLACVQARRAAGCGMRYLGASTNCSVIVTALFALANPSAILTWQLIRV